MSDELVGKFRVQLDGKEELNSFFESTGRGAEKFSAGLRKNLASAGGAISSFAGKASSQLQEFAGKELGGSIGSNARGILQLRDSITALAIASDKGTEIVGGLKDQIQSTSVATNQLQGDVTDAMRAFVDQTGDLDTARLNMELYGRTATATGAAMKEIALVGVELKDKLNITDQAKAFAILAEQSKGGAIHLKDFAKQGSRILNVAASAGVTGEAGLREVGALSETYAKYVGGSGASKAARVATAVENTFASIAKKASRIESAGIKVEGRDRFDVLFDIIRKTGGNETKLREVFSQQAMRGLLGIAVEYRKTGRFDTYEGLRQRKVDEGVLDKDFASRVGTGESKIKQQQIQRQAFFDKYLGGIAEFSAAHATELQAGAFGLGIAGKGLSLLGRVGGGVGGKLGGALSAAGASRVFVVNWPAGGIGSGGTGGSGSAIGKAIPLIGLGLVAQEAAQQALGRIKAGGGLHVSDAMNDYGNFDKKKFEAAIFDQKAALFNKFQEENAAKAAATNNIKIEIHGDDATVTEDNGTRSKVALERRKAEGD